MFPGLYSRNLYSRNHWVLPGKIDNLEKLPTPFLSALVIDCSSQERIVSLYMAFWIGFFFPPFHFTGSPWVIMKSWEPCQLVMDMPCEPEINFVFYLQKTNRKLTVQSWRYLKVSIVKLGILCLFMLHSKIWYFRGWGIWMCLRGGGVIWFTQWNHTPCLLPEEQCAASILCCLN